MKALISEPLDEIMLTQSGSNQESLQVTSFNTILQSQESYSAVRQYVKRPYLKSDNTDHIT